MRTEIPADRLKWMALVTVALGYFAVQLAMTSVPPMLPTLASLFESDVSLVSWTMTAYFLTITSSLLMAGRLGDLIAHGSLILKPVSNIAHNCLILRTPVRHDCNSTAQG